MKALHVEALDELLLLEPLPKHCLFTYIKLIALPSLVYGYAILGYLGWVNFPISSHSIILIGIIYAVALLFAKHNAEYGTCYFKRHIARFRQELKQYIAQNLLSIGAQTKSNASFEHFLDHYSKQIRNDNYASVGASIFPTMGILGTFISMAFTMPDFASQTASALEKEIGILLSGVGTAFYVSIYGILLSLWWIFFEKRGLSRFEKTIEAIRIDCTSFFWSKAEIEQAYLKENLAHFEKIAQMFEHLSGHHFFEKLHQTIEEKFGLFDAMLKLEAQAVKMGAEHIKEGMEVILRSQEKQHTLNDHLEAITQTFKAFHESTLSLQRTISKEHEALNATFAEIKEELGEPKAYSDPEEVISLKKSLQEIDAQTEEIIQKMDALK